MRHRTVLATLLMIGMSAPAFAAAPVVDPSHPHGINAREHRQSDRIKDGVKDGELTKGELDKLKGDEAAVRAEERVFRQSGGGLNKSEYKDLEKDLNKTSREIYRLKHNGR